MHKTCKIVGRDGKGNGRAWSEKALTEALTEYLKGRSREAWRFAYRLCRDEEEAGELVQEACYRVLKAGGRYRAGAPVKSWLFTILRNAFQDSRRRKGRNAVSLDWLDEEERVLHDRLAESGEAMLRRLERQETARRVRAAVSGLARADREVVMLCDLRRLPYAAVARRLHVAEGTVRSRLVRARAKLRRAAVSMDLY